MSLFKYREWWEIHLNESNSYDGQSLLTFRLDNDEFESILLGSHGGLLRLFSPSPKTIDGVPVSGYEPSHLLLEVQLTVPILQISQGFLVSGSQEKQLAILHPRLFSVYIIKKKETQDTNVGYQVTLELAYQHVLRHSSHSFVLGKFGGVRGRHFISILSLDGLLSFYEQESFAFQLYLPDFLFPFAFTYLEKTDSFLFLNGYLTFDCYSYESIASSCGGTGDRKPAKSWEYNLGEGIIDVQTVDKNGLTIVVLSERNLYGLNENGNLVFAKRLEYTPVAFCTYLTDENSKLMIVIATDERYINLYEETNLRWSMKIGQIPVCVRRIFLHQLPGGLVLLSEDGYVQCVYVGTHPSVYLVSPLSEAEIDMSTAESELTDLQKKIKTNDMIDPAISDLLNVQVKVDRSVKMDKDRRYCAVMVELDAQSFIRSLQVLVHVDPPLVSTSTSIFFTNFTGKTFFESSVHLDGIGVPSSLFVHFVVTYITDEGVTGCISKTDVLPLSLAFVRVPPLKEAQYKLTLGSNKPISDLNHIFKEFTANDNAPPHAIGLKLLNSDSVVTILGAKSSQRYRIQADALPMVTLPLFALIERLKLQFRKHNDFRLVNSGLLPLEVYYEHVRVHHDLLNKRKRLEDDLRKETSQYRTIQKKVLATLKDSTPKSSSAFQKLLSDTFKKISSSLELLDQLEEELELSRCSIASLNRLLSGLIELNITQAENRNLIDRLFEPYVEDTDEQGCLEIQETTVSYLLRAVLNKNGKDEDKLLDINKGPIKDTHKLTKHLSMAVDRILKGTYNVRTVQDGEEIQAEIDDFMDDPIPAGTKFANLSQESRKVNDLVENQKTDEKKVHEAENVKAREEEDVQIRKEGYKEEQEEDKHDINPSESADVPVAVEADDDDAIWDIKINEVKF